MPGPSISLEGFDDVRKALVAYGGTGPDAKALNRHVVDEVLIPPSKVEAPKRSGKLSRSIRADASPTYGYILAGVAGSVPYGPVIHYGWSTRGLGRGKLTGSITNRRSQLDVANMASGGGLSKRATNKAARQSMAKYRKELARDPITGEFRSTGRKVLVRQAVRGGPIKPNPFIYRAIDARRQDVLDEYESQLNTRAKIEGLL